MRIVVTGAARGIGRAATLKYLSLGHEVHGIDISPSDIDSPQYTHHIADIRKSEALPDIDGAAVLFNNAGIQQGAADIATNLVGAINVTEKYIQDNDALRSILFNASASSISGQEFPHYVASKAGLVGYMRNVAIRVAPRRVTCNAISLGGVLTDSNDVVMKDSALWQAVMSVTPMKKWTTLDEVCEWVVFLTLTNRSMSGQNLLIDNGEMQLNPTFVWPEYSEQNRSKPM
jgi:3-oxoacyl-[acyl-carrier protein] reductase